MKKQSFQSSRSGFTLIELLVVIAIIAILAAILFPVFAQAREKARQTSCLSNGKQMGLSMLMYAQDYDETFVFSPIWDWPASGLLVGWPKKIEPYMKSYPVLRCPSDDGEDNNPGPTGTDDYRGPWISWAANGLTSWGTVTPGGGNDPIGVVTPRYPWEAYDSGTVASINRPADTIMLAEKHSNDLSKAIGWPNDGGGRNRTDFHPTNIFMTDTATQGSWCSWIGCIIPNGKRAASAYPNGINGGVSAKHAGRANIVFVDGHVKSMKPEQTNPDPINLPNDNMWDSRRK